jgi:hypothetical protein
MIAVGIYGGGMEEEETAGGRRWWWGEGSTGSILADH